LRVQINGETRELVGGLTLIDLIRDLSLAPERVAIELNHQVMRRSEWSQTILRDGDRIEIIHFVGGGVANRGCK
jgi:thiamine biosynthesis protein ThiS